MDELEHNLMRSLIAQRELGTPEQIQESERRLYEYQLKIGSPLAYFTYERR